MTAFDDSALCESPPATPEARDDAAATTTDTPVSIDVLANDTDPQGDTLRVARLTAPGHGTATAGAGGTVTYVPAQGFDGTDTFTYTVHDGRWGTDQAVVTVTVAARNQAPHVDAGPDLTLTLPADTAVLNGAVSDDGQPPPGTLQALWSQAAGPGTVLFATPSSPTTSAQFPAAGQYTVRLTATDGELSSSDEAEVTLLPAWRRR